MLVFTKIPYRYLNEISIIDIRSNQYYLSQKVIHEYYKRYNNCGAFIDNNLVAFIFYQIIVDEAEVLHIVCDKKYQGNNYSYQLFRNIICENYEINNIKTWHLEVRKSNKEAISLYKRLGFIDVGIRRSYYQNNDNAILMKLTK